MLIDCNAAKCAQSSAMYARGAGNLAGLAESRVRHMEALNAQVGPVLCAHRTDPRITELVAEASAGPPLFEAEGMNAVVHSLWQVAEPEAVGAFGNAPNALDALYIADGHHRSAAAARVAATRRQRAREGAKVGDSHEYFLVVTFPHDELRILDYNRVIAGLGGRTPAELLEAVQRDFEVEPLRAPSKPGEPATYAMYLDRQWYRLRLRKIDGGDDPVASLDISRLQRALIEPLFGIADPRIDKRIDFVGGIRGLGELERRVDSGDAAVAFALYPTSMEQLMAVADAELLMPPKITRISGRWHCCTCRLPETPDRAFPVTPFHGARYGNPRRVPRAGGSGRAGIADAVSHCIGGRRGGFPPAGLVARAWA